MNKRKHVKNSPPTTEPVLLNERIVKKNTSSIIGFLSTVYGQAIFLFGLAILLYVNTLGFDYNLDDGVVITGNKFTKAGFAGIKDLLSHDLYVAYGGDQQNFEGGRYRPLTEILFAIEYQFFGLNPFIGHLVNIITYAFTCVFMFYLLQKLLLKNKNDTLLSIPFIAMILFVAHPLHTEVVANIKGLDEIFSLLLSVATLWFSVKYVESKNNLSLVWIILLFFLAMLSKENSVTFFAVVPLTFYVFTSAKIKDYVFVLAAMFVAFAIFMYMRYKALGFLITSGNTVQDLLNNPFVNASKAEKYATIFYTWGKYLLLLFFPHPLTHDYYPKVIPIVNWANFRAFIPLIIYGGVFIYSLINVRKKSIIAYAFLFFLITFSISSNLFIPVNTFMNERFMFTPLLGFCIFIAYLLVKKSPSIITDTATYQKSVIIFTAVTLLAFTIKTISRNLVWKNGYTLFTSDVKTSDNSAKCNISAAGLMMTKALSETDSVTKYTLLKQAIIYMEKGVSIYPFYDSGWLILGRAEIELKNYKYATMATENCLNINSGYPEALTNLRYLAEINSQNKNYSDAIGIYKALLKYMPENYDSYIAIAGIYERENKIDSSIIILNNAIIQVPSYAGFYAKLGSYYGKFYNDFDKALSYSLKAYQLDSTNTSALENLGIINGIKKDYKASVYYFNKAIIADPGNISLYQNIAVSYKSLGKAEKEKEYLAKAAQLEAQTTKKK